MATTQARLAYAGGAKKTTIDTALGTTTLSWTIASTTGWASGSNEFYVVINPTKSNAEKALVTRSGNTLTCASTAKRGVDGTTAQEHDPGSTIYPIGPAATEMDVVNEFLSLPTAKGEIAIATAADTWGSLAVGANNSVLVADSSTATGWKVATTLAGLTLTAPTIADFSNAAHDHLDADDGGTLTMAAVTDLVSAWASFAATANGSDGVVTTFYKQKGKTVEYRGKLVAVSAFSANVTVTLPAAAAASTIQQGTWTYYDASATAFYHGTAYINSYSGSATALLFGTNYDGPAGRIGVGVPVADASGDAFFWNITYETA